MSSLLSRIHQVAVQRPDAVAVDGEVSVSYAHLWDRASAVAARVSAATKDPRAPVGIAMRRSPDAIAALLGAMLANRPYVPLDTGLPEARLQTIVRDVAPDCILTDAANAAIGGTAVDHERVDRIGAEGDSREAPRFDADALVYVMYTSGSTGIPKGVAMRHGALANLMQWQLADSRLGPPARTLQLTPLTFDVSFQEILGCLCSGGTLVVVDENARHDPAHLAQLLIDTGIERLYLPFVGLQQLAEAALATRRLPIAMRDVVTAGEQLQATPAIVDFFERLPECRLHNHYGPCETHVVTVHTLGDTPSRWPLLPPIGRAIPNVDVRVLDRGGNTVPDGEEGEIFLGGGCLAQGYWGRPQLTEERFVADPRGDSPQQRLYRTGDLGRYVDGELEWIGRNDHQVKVRGYRVELGEVETVLAQHPAVRQAVVVPRKRKATTELIAYLLASDDEEASPAALDSVDEWCQVWQRIYDGSTPEDPTFHTAGWNSSYTNEPFPADEMEEWVDGAVRRIAQNRLGRVLEIGCGTGLLLFRLAPESARYVGIDFSARAIDYVRRQVAASPSLSEKVDVHEAAAHELADIAPGVYDVIVLNSVTQHFPSASYLADVVGQAVARLSPEGVLFVGDVSSKRHRHAFHTDVELSKLPPSATVEQLRSLVRHRSELDAELTVDPAFFETIPAINPDIACCEIHLKRGRARNEMSMYRYDAVLRRRPPDRVITETRRWEDAAGPALGVDPLIELIARGGCVRRVPDARLAGVYDLVARLDAAEPEQLVAGITGEQASTTGALDPEDLYAAAERAGVEIEVRPSASPGCFDVVPAGGEAVSQAGSGDGSRAQWLASTSDPQRRKRAERVVPEVRDFAARNLPGYMQPASWMLVDHFPKTRSGKVDRAALPSPSRDRPVLATDYAAPGSDVERTIESVWRELLQLSRVGIDDPFYELGGNSLLILDLSLRLGSALGREVPAVQILAHPTVRRLAASLEQTGAEGVSEAHSRGARQRGAFGNRPRHARARQGRS